MTERKKKLLKKISKGREKGSVDISGLIKK